MSAKTIIKKMDTGDFEITWPTGETKIIPNQGSAFFMLGFGMGLYTRPEEVEYK